MEHVQIGSSMYTPSISQEELLEVYKRAQAAYNQARDEEAVGLIKYILDGK